MVRANLPRWLSAVHHDGSARYLSRLHPRFGDKVRIRLRALESAPIRRAFLRTCPDGEEMLLPLSPSSPRNGVRFFAGDLQVEEPVVHYRFTLEAEDGVWFYGAAGPSAHDPLDAADFRLLAGEPPPAWFAEAIFYQIFPDRFENGEPAQDPGGGAESEGPGPRTCPWGVAPPAGRPFAEVFYGGDLPGIVRRLDHVQRLGADVLYLNPVFASPSNHRYDTADYDHVDPHLGGDEALVRLREALSARGMRYLLDLVPNHVGATHAWFQAARRDRQAPEAEFFTFLAHPDRYLSWLGVKSLPKLDYRSPELFARMITGPDAVVKRWLRPPYSADGWRVDVANMLGRSGRVQLAEQVARAIRSAVKQTRPDAMLLGEHFYDASPMLQGDQWDAVMNYAGFALPLWHWLRGFRQRAHGIDPDLSGPPGFPTLALLDAWQARRAAIPWAVLLRQYNLIGSHDVPRIRSVVSGNASLHKLAAAVQFTYPGLPSIYYGDEIGMEDLPLLGERGCMTFDEARWDRSTFAHYQKLVALRRASEPLRSGGFEVLPAEADTLFYQREGASGRVLVVAHRGEAPRPEGPVRVREAGVPDGLALTDALSGRTAVVKEGALELPELEQGASIWVAERDGAAMADE